MKLVVFGLSISSAWGNGHATLWRGLIRALAERGHHVVFFERDREFYSSHRDAPTPIGCELILYREWNDIAKIARDELRDCDAAIATSFCPDGEVAITSMLESAPTRRVFYDLDTPVTLETLDREGQVFYLGRHDLRDFDLVLSFTGGRSLLLLKDRLNARRVATLYGSVDPVAHRAVAPSREYSAELSYLGTFADDREAALRMLFIESARRRPHARFLIAGAKHRQDEAWPSNLHHFDHVAPNRHPTFYSSSRLTLNLTRAVMARSGYCPSGRLFEASACGTPIVSDEWEGIETFFTPGEEILLVHTSDDVLEAIDLTEIELRRLAQAARERTLTCHTAAHRAEELIALLEREG